MSYVRPGFNLCIQLGADCDGDNLPKLLESVADLMEIEVSLSNTVDPVTQTNLLKCRLASLAEQVGSANDIVGDSKEVSVSPGTSMP